ncbi:hypothetical protein J421_5455 (plasmid) [Gemmatirosa kalamazoonensis]|uniref:Immunity MXAN-0049 protein domain-containing protein n=1 Tax=Gemmatirosa kalamazoonensis TaxID=861299 RepID=W0RRN8_9BACT|nr:DUF1629 domain-containing protein [Gemmatirosa kalamazoonensis]AHG92990.1 hypothetical protein J421_5455 [Gemmatirosa kalamazoonensis]
MSDHDASRFYRLRSDPLARRKGLHLARIDRQADSDLPWWVGARFAAPPATPIRCTLDESGGPDLPDAFLAEAIPIMSARLVDALRAAGADNLDAYDAQLVDPRTGAPVGDYRAVNVVGLARAADMTSSVYDAASEFPMIEFDRVVVDPAAVGELRMFRLAENPSYILVAQGVKDALDAVGLVGVIAAPLDERIAY